MALKLKKDQRLQIVVRALILRDGRLLITQWRDGYGFLIGGRVEHGEPLDQAVLREVQEETGATGRLGRLAYFAENFWEDQGLAWHEYGWYYLVEVDGEIAAPDAVLPNPDHPDLVIRWLPLTELPESGFYPQFLSRYLLSDVCDGFRAAPRHIVTDQRGDAVRIWEVDDRRSG